MAEVYGIIGNEQVELNNAATESTLKQLLAAVMMGSKQSLDNVNKMAQKLGLDPTKVQETNTGLSSLGKGAQTLGAGYAGLSVATGQLSSAFRGIQGITQEFTSGAGQASSILTTFSRIGGPLGAVFSGMSMLAEFQETQLSQYQSLTQAGVNFGGSLTDLRLSASMAGLTVEQFTGILSRNSEKLTALGGTADAGAVAFKKLSANLYASETGAKLRALGITAEQQNEAIITYMALSGGRSRKELANTESQLKATANYLLQLDELARITGKSKEEQEKKLKAEMEEADFQLFLSTKSEAERKAITDSMTRATALYGKAGADIVKAQAMGVAVQGEEGKRLMALSSETGESIQKDLQIRLKYGNDIEKLNANEIEGRKANVRDMERIAGPVASFGGAIKGIEDSVKQSAKDRMLGEKGIEQQYSEISRERAAQAESEAKLATETQAAITELGQSIMTRLMPMISSLLPPLNSFMQGLLSVVEWLVKTPAALSALATVTGVVVAGFTALKVAQAVAAAREIARTGGRKLGTPGAPMIVQDISGGLGKGGAGPGPTGGLGGKLLKGAKGLGIGAVLGLGADFAADMLGRETTAGASADVLGSAASMAGTGAMVGSIIPGLGTAIGAGIGGLAGGAYGLYQNWGTIFGSGAKPIPKPAMPEKSAVEAEISEKALSLPGITIADPMEKMAAQLERLNTQTLEMIRYLRETAEQARRNVEATRSLNGNLFPTP